MILPVYDISEVVGADGEGLEPKFMRSYNRCYQVRVFSCERGTLN